MKKRILSMLLALIMALSLVPVTAFAAATLEGYFDGLPVIAETEPGTPGSTNKWKVTTLDGEDVLISGNAGKSSSSSTLQLTFTSDVHMTSSTRSPPRPATTSVPSRSGAPRS